MYKKKCVCSGNGLTRLPSKPSNSYFGSGLTPSGGALKRAGEGHKRGGFLGLTAMGLLTLGVTIAKDVILARRGRGVGGEGKVLDKLKEIVKKVKVVWTSLPQGTRDKIKQGLIMLKNDPSKATLLKVGRSLAPDLTRIVLSKVNKKINAKGSGLSVAGGALKLSGSGSDVAFAKKFATAMISKLK